MTCGCKTVSLPQTPRENAALCFSCIWGERNAFLDVTHCGISGKVVESHIQSGKCPKGRYPKAGMVFSWGTFWYGIPAYTRMFVWLFHPNRPKWSSFSGCGCWAPAKDLWTRLVGTN